ncbi:MAG: hypothetical protein P8Z81_14545 [Deinococcales bacterium]|jgi:hypothetical protein
MRKIVIMLCIAATLAGGAAFAQGSTTSEHYWVGFSAGYPAADLHFGISNAFPNFGVRANFGFGYFGYGFTVGLDGLYTLPINTGNLPIVPYIGLGPTAAFGYLGGFAVGANLFGGLEYRLGQIGFEPGGVFFEVGPSVYFVPTVFAGVFGRFGFNYHF